MNYFKVKPTRDQYKIGNTILVKNELYTESQLKNMPIIQAKISVLFDLIAVSKNSTYYFFGARFCTQYPYNS